MNTKTSGRVDGGGGLRVYCGEGKELLDVVKLIDYIVDKSKKLFDSREKLDAL